MDTHTALHQLRGAILSLIAAESCTNSPSCITHIRRAVVDINKVADGLGIDLAKHVDPMM